MDRILQIIYFSTSVGALTAAFATLSSLGAADNVRTLYLVLVAVFTGLDACELEEAAQQNGKWLTSTDPWLRRFDWTCILALVAAIGFASNTQITISGHRASALLACLATTLSVVAALFYWLRIPSKDPDLCTRIAALRYGPGANAERVDEYVRGVRAFFVVSLALVVVLDYAAWRWHGQRWMEVAAWATLALGAAFNALLESRLYRHFMSL